MCEIIICIKSPKCCTIITSYFILLSPPVLRVFHQFGEIGEVGAKAHHTFIPIQPKCHIPELRQVPLKHIQQ